VIGKAAGIAGNTIWISFIVAAIIAAFSALSFCELSTTFPRAAAEFVYVKKAFNRQSLAFVIGWMVIFTGVFGSATVALAFGGYFSELVLPFFHIPMVLGAAMLVIGMTLVNLYGIEQSAKANIVFTVIETFGLVFIIALGIKYFGSVNYFEMPSGGITSIITAAALVFFAYVGFEDIANVAEETKNPEKTLPKAIIISILVTTILYILVAISSISIIPWQILGQSNAPLAIVAEKALPGTSSLLSSIALFSTGNTVLILLIVISRMIYGMARGGVLPMSLSKISSKRKTPWVAGLITMILVLCFILLKDIRRVAEVSNFTILIVFVAINISLIYLRYTKPYLVRPFKVPLNIGRFPVLPFLGIIFSLFLMTYFSTFTIILGSGIFVLGFVLYKIIQVGI